MKCWLLFIAFLALFLAQPAWPEDLALSDHERKIALVIGNDAYEHQPRLQKAVGDARAVRDSLERLGFAVTLAENMDFAAMIDALTAFEADIQVGDIVAIHFSGHGVAADGNNYLLPVDFPRPASIAQRRAILPRLAFDAGEIVRGLSSRGANLTLAIFDACRENLLADGTRSSGLSRGLVRIDPPVGVFIMFSAGPGELARDRLDDQDSSPTSVFTRVFLPILETPGLTLVEVAKLTQVAVRELAGTINHEQFPDYSDRVLGDVVLVPAVEPVPASPDTSEPGAPKESDIPQATSPSGEEHVAWWEQSGPSVHKGQRATYYFQGSEGSPGRMIEGIVTWAEVTREDRPAIEATLRLPEITTTFTIARNYDTTLPASHIIEIQFSGSLGASRIERVPALVMKQTEQARGQPLTGAAVPVTNKLFWIALSDDPADVSRNMQLLREGPWFDLPILFSDQTRALLTFEKGIPGDRIFETVMSGWEKWGATTDPEDGVDIFLAETLPERLSPVQEEPSPEFRTLPNGTIVRIR